MKLLKVSNIQLEEFIGNTIPEYAILSHTWSEGEATFQDFQSNQERNKAGYAKIKNTCRQASIDGFEYVWIDTCCIDKSSSAELSEAINSMYSYYTKAKRCYAYIEDARDFNFRNPADEKEFEKCRWFTRGWTLQELIAPKEVIFFSCNWVKIGTKEELCKLVSKITNIDIEVLQSPSDVVLSRFSIAKRMSWASKRETSRVEDMAYCLLGLFGVNMPLIYGEEDKAFQRLQEGIMGYSHDHSIFAWGHVSADMVGPQKGDSAASSSSYFETDRRRLLAENSKGTLLAPSPAAFASSSNVVSFRADRNTVPYRMTNLGLHVEFAVCKNCVQGFPGQPETRIAVLNCYLRNNLNDQLGIFISPTDVGSYRLGHGKMDGLRLVVSSKNSRSYVRLTNRICLVPRDQLVLKTQEPKWEFRKMYFWELTHSIEIYHMDPRQDQFFIPRSLCYRVIKVDPELLWDGERQVIRWPDDQVERPGWQVNWTASIYLDVEWPMKEKLITKPQIVVFVGWLVNLPHYSAEPIWAIKQCPANVEAGLGMLSRYDSKMIGEAKETVIENGVTMEISVMVQPEMVMGQIMYVVRINSTMLKV